MTSINCVARLSSQSSMPDSRVVTTRYLSLLSLILVVVAAVTTTPAIAQTSNITKPDDRPSMVQSLNNDSGGHRWTDGVSEEHQRAATDLFVEGNILLKDSYFLQAEAKYREALAHWDHPGIRYNLALALTTSQADPLKIRQQFVAALRYGADPLDEEKFKYATYSLSQIEQRLASVEISCNVLGAIVSLDDTALFNAPGQYKDFVSPGPHTIRAAKSGFEPTELHETLLPGKPSRFNLPIYAQEQLIEKHSRWPFWIPATVTVGGVALLGLGGLLLAHSNSKLEQFDQQVKSRPDCKDDGCPADASLSDLRSSSKSYKTGATITLAAGAAVFSAGVALMILDIPVSRQITTEEHEKKLQLQPAVSLGYAGFVSSGRF